MAPERLAANPVHLGLGARAEVEPAFTGDLSWYAGYVERHAADGDEARLIAEHSFEEPWDLWEMHPNGAEVVIVTAGELVLHQERDGRQNTVVVGPGEYAINEPGTWHTADVDEPTTVIFVTAGVGTQHRPR